jgi:hypothetical protein
MTRTGDVSTATRDHCNCESRRATGVQSSSVSNRRREARKPQGRRDRRLGCRPVARKRRSGMVREPAPSGRHGTASERRRDASDTARETPGSICPAPRRRRAANRPGR